jgi:hypothetical protein
MKNKEMKVGNSDLAIIKKIPIRKAYSSPRLVYYGNLDELTQIGDNAPPWGDWVNPWTETGYTHQDIG